MLNSFSFFSNGIAQDNVWLILKNCKETFLELNIVFHELFEKMLNEQ